MSRFVLLGMLVPCATFAQSMPAHDMGAMPGMDMSQTKPAAASKAKSASKKPVPAHEHAAPEHAAHEHSAAPTASPEPPTPTVEHAAMQHDEPTDRAAPSGVAPATTALRDPDAYADGLSREHRHGMDMDDDARYLRVLVERLETFHDRAGHGQAVDAQAWYGGDLEKLWLKVDGERVDGRLGATRTEVVWDHAIAPYWGWQTGLRQDFGLGPGRTWGSFGVQGLSPYRFDVQVAAYVGEGGRTALRAEVAYDLVVVRRLVLQALVKADAYGRSDARGGIGAGVSHVEAGLRWRYEIDRRVAPYIGVVWTGALGNTARIARNAGEAVDAVEAVAGVRLWF